MYALLLAALLSKPYSGAIYDASQQYQGGYALSLDVIFNDPAWIYEKNRTTDAAPFTLNLQAGNSWSQASGANLVGGALLAMGGIGSRFVTVSVTGANSAGDTYTPTINGTAGQVLTARNGGAVAHEFNCITSNAVCALAFKTAYNTEAYTGSTASCIDGTCSDGKVYFDLSAGTVYTYTHAIVDNAGGAFGTATTSTDGGLQLRNNAVGDPALSFASDSNTGLRWSGNEAFCLMANGGCSATVNTNGLSVAGGFMFYSTGTGGASFFPLNTAQTPDAALIGTGSLSNSLIIAEYADNATDFAHAQQTNPTVWIQSAAQATPLQYLALSHNQTNGVLSVGVGDLELDYVGTKAGVLAEVLLSSTQVTANSVSDQTLYTVPSGKVAYVTKAMARDASAAITNTTAAIGNNAGACNNIVTAVAYNALADGTLYQTVNPIAGSAKETAAAGVICWRTTVQEAAADTIIIDLFGHLR